MRAPVDAVPTMLRHFKNHTLVVGWALEGHDFLVGDRMLTGRTVPWNTLALWAVDKLGWTGFPMIGDGIAGNRQMGGVEVFICFPIH
jgi:hypothetical protein